MCVYTAGEEREECNPSPTKLYPYTLEEDFFTATRFLARKFNGEAARRCLTVCEISHKIIFVPAVAFNGMAGRARAGSLKTVYNISISGRAGYAVEKHERYFSCAVYQFSLGLIKS